MRSAPVLLLLLLVASVSGSGCGTSSTGVATAGPGGCVATITNAAGANNAFQGLSGGIASGDWSGPSGMTIVCNTLSQALELHLSGATPNVGVTYAVSADPTTATGNAALLKYGESKSANGVSTHVTWLGTAGTVTIDAAAKDNVTFRFSGVTAVVDPGSSQNLATGTMTLSGSGNVDDLLGFVP